VHYDIDGLSVVVALRSGGTEKSPAALMLSITPAAGRTIRVPNPEIRIKAMQDNTEVVHPIQQWKGSDYSPGGSMALKESSRMAPRRGR
jgi:hypothetical protein